jgi:hypothetical protein
VIQDFLGELQALADAAATGDDQAISRGVAARGDVYVESYWAGVREGQRVVSERLQDILDCHGPFC